jgi:hypothetical protein
MLGHLCCLYWFPILESSQKNIFLSGEVVSLMPNPQPGGPGYPFFVWAMTFDLSGMGGPTSSYTTASMAFDHASPTTVLK